MARRKRSKNSTPLSRKGRGKWGPGNLVTCGNNRKGNAVIVIALLFALAVCVAVMFHAGREIIERHDEYAEARSEYDELRELVGAAATPPAAGEEAEDLDLPALIDIAPNVIGWIVVPAADGRSGTGISYPIVQGADNVRYLNHTVSGARNGSGAIFLDYRDCSSFTARALVYGHNMRDGAMFAALHGWAGDTFVIHTPAGTLTFAVTFRGAVPLAEVAAHDGITLVTCVNGQPSVRYIVRGRLI